MVGEGSSGNLQEAPDSPVPLLKKAPRRLHPHPWEGSHQKAPLDWSQGRGVGAQGCVRVCWVEAETCHRLGQLLMALVLVPNVFVWIHQGRVEAGTQGMKGPQESWLTASQGIPGKSKTQQVRLFPGNLQALSQVSPALWGVTLTKAL